MGERIDDNLEKVMAHTAQVTTDAYAGVPESHLKAYNKNRIDYWLANEDDTNSIIGKVVGRYTQQGGGAGDWQDVTGEVTVGTETGAKLATLTDLQYDEYAVEVKAASGGSQGDARVYGGARLVPDRAPGENAIGATLTPIAEVANEIDVTVQLSVAEARPVHLELFIGAQVTSGPLVDAATSAFRISDGGAGSVLSGAATREAVALTDANGTFVATLTDVAGASGLSVIMIARDGSKDGRFLGAVVAKFD